MRKAVLLTVFAMIAIAVFGIVGCGGGGSIGSDAIAADGDVMVTLNFQPSPSEADGIVDGYRIYYGRQSGNYTGHVDLFMTYGTEMILREKGTWYFAAMAYYTSSEFGFMESVFSNEVHFIVISPDDETPKAPGVLTIEKV